MRILCYGDSNTYGFDPRSYLAGRYSPGERWPELLGTLTGYEVINAGLNGREIPHTTAQIRDAQALLQHYAPDLTVVMLGSNDLLQGIGVEEIRCRMAQFLTSVSPYAGNVLLAAPPMKRGAWVPENALVEAAILLRDAYRQLAQEKNILFADGLLWQIGLAFDGVHFTQEGHQTFARQLQQLLNEQCP